MKKLLLIVCIAILAPVAFGQTKTEMKPSELSKTIRDYCAKNFKSLTIERAFKVDSKGVITYDLLLAQGAEKAVFIFDKDGKFLKRAERGTRGGTQIAPATQPQPQPGQKNQPAEPKKSEPKK